ncbi:hypothetical protein SprV_0200624900 [Sparganum proliferum]
MSDPNRTKRRHGYDYFLQANSACGPAPNCSRTSPQRPALPTNTYNASPGVNSRATASSNNLGFTTTSVGLLGPRQPGGGGAAAALTPSSPSGGLGGGGGGVAQQHNRCSRMNPGHVAANNGGGCGSGTNNHNDRSKEILENGNHHHHPHHLAPEHSAALVRGGGGGSSNRFFDDLETQVVVKLFSDYFTSGSCPSLSEVRHRIANSVLQIHRNATSIRAKVKRLQTSGQTGRLLGSRIHEHKLAVRRGDALSQVAAHTYEMGYEFNFAATRIVAHAGNKTGRELIEAWASDENLDNRFIDLAPAYRALRSHLQPSAVGQ